MRPAQSRDSVAFARPRFLDGVELVTVSYRDRAFPVHTHEGYVVGTVIEGAEELSVRGRTYTVSRGDALLLHPHEPHANRSLGREALRYRVFYLPAHAIAAYAGERGDAPPTFSAPVVSDPALAGTIAGLHARLSKGPDDRLAQQSALAALIDALLGRTESRAARPQSGGDAARAVRDWIDDHFAEDFGLSDLAARADLSVFRFAHVFKACTGLSPMAYRNQCRVNAARRRLLGGEPIAQVALDVGFADQSHLTRWFQRIVGVSPQRYRQQ
ncbi:AraC family transcriptional regulator [Pelagerythrobacter aerophilus]|uniref:AraC family transcriptional regulator n=1 Tax=Pelagerythrobacter aerophilus TaxID=2306995 RepID=A0A418NHF1_9SPHN|nr:AraC family transcriptional regulator [Pelagerythrobacter aerophilus]RIV78037.1 AraC family transcriptional regulator [Pelagerythrobacter aerophilus]